MVDDSLYEGEETVQLSLINPQGGALGIPATAQLTLDDDADQPVFLFDNPSYSLREDEEVATITVLRGGDLSEGATVHYHTRDGSAIEGADYGAVSGTLAFAPGESQLSFGVPVIDDGLLEGPETVTLTLSEPLPGLIGIPGTAVLTIADDPPDTVTYYFDPASYTLSEDGGSTTITVVRGGDISVPAAVDYFTTNGSATAGEDYLEATGTLQFASGEATQTFSVAVLDDNFQEGAETVELAIANPRPGALGSPTIATLTIQDDAADIGTFRFSSSAYSAAEESGSVVI